MTAGPERLRMATRGKYSGPSLCPFKYVKKKLKEKYNNNKNIYIYKLKTILKNQNPIPLEWPASLSLSPLALPSLSLLSLLLLSPSSPLIALIVRTMMPWPGVYSFKRMWLGGGSSNTWHLTMCAQTSARKAGSTSASMPREDGIPPA